MFQPRLKTTSIYHQQSEKSSAEEEPSKVTEPQREESEIDFFRRIGIKYIFKNAQLSAMAMWISDWYREEKPKLDEEEKKSLAWMNGIMTRSKIEEAKKAKAEEAESRRKEVESYDSRNKERQAEENTEARELPPDF